MRAPVNDDYCVIRCYKLLLDDHTIPQPARNVGSTLGPVWAHFGPTFRAGWVGLIYTPSVKRGRFMSIIPDVLVYSLKRAERVAQASALGSPRASMPAGDRW